MKILTLAALVASLAFATIAMADTTVDTSKAATAKVQTTTPAAVPAAKTDKTTGCTMQMAPTKSGGCCGM